MRRDLKPEYLFLGLLEGRAAHGYELYRRFSQELGTIWNISESQMYATLRRLEERGLIEGGAAEKGEAASRRPLSATHEGRRLFAEWLERPTAPNPRSLALEFTARLHFAERLGSDIRHRLLLAQIGEVRRAVESMDRHESRGLQALERLSLDFRRAQLEAALVWLMKIEEGEPSATAAPGRPHG